MKTRSQVASPGTPLRSRQLKLWRERFSIRSRQATTVAQPLQGGNVTEKTAKPFRVVVFADFVCPYSYLAVEQIDRLAREYEVQPLWRPYWLHPDTPLKGKPRDTADDDAKRERLHAWVKEMAPEQYPRIRFPQKRQYSFSAFEALEFAYDHGLDFSFKTALYEMMWTQERDIGEPET